MQFLHFPQFEVLKLQELQKLHIVSSSAVIGFSFTIILEIWFLYFVRIYF